MWPSAGGEQQMVTQGRAYLVPRARVKGLYRGCAETKHPRGSLLCFGGCLWGQGHALIKPSLPTQTVPTAPHLLWQAHHRAPPALSPLPTAWLPRLSPPSGSVQTLPSPTTQLQHLSVTTPDLPVFYVS